MKSSLTPDETVYSSQFQPTNHIDCPPNRDTAAIRVGGSNKRVSTSSSDAEDDTPIPRSFAPPIPSPDPRSHSAAKAVDTEMSYPSSAYSSLAGSLLGSTGSHTHRIKAAGAMTASIPSNSNSNGSSSGENIYYLNHSSPVRHAEQTVVTGIASLQATASTASSSSSYTEQVSLQHSFPAEVVIAQQKQILALQQQVELLQTMVARLESSSSLHTSGGQSHVVTRNDDSVDNELRHDDKVLDSFNRDISKQCTSAKAPLDDTISHGAQGDRILKTEMTSHVADDDVSKASKASSTLVLPEHTLISSKLSAPLSLSLGSISSPMVPSKSVYNRAITPLILPKHDDDDDEERYYERVVDEQVSSIPSAFAAKSEASSTISVAMDTTAESNLEYDQPLTEQSVYMMSLAAFGDDFLMDQRLLSVSPLTTLDARYGTNNQLRTLRKSTSPAAAATILSPRHYFAAKAALDLKDKSNKKLTAPVVIQNKGSKSTSNGTRIAASASASASTSARSVNTSFSLSTHLDSTTTTTATTATMDEDTLDMYRTDIDSKYIPVEELSVSGWAESNVSLLQNFNFIDLH